jgi:hypothetical protein
MSMEITKAAQQASDERNRAALQAGDTESVQLGPNIEKARNQVFRLGLGRGGNGQD